VPGAILFMRPGTTHKPFFLEPAKLAPEIFMEVSAILEGINRKTGVSELAKQSTAPGNIIAASAIAGLQEQDNTRINLPADQAKAFWVNNHIKLLSLYRDNVVYPRMVKDIGKDHEFEISQFVGSSLTSFDIEVIPEPASEVQLAQMRQKAVELLNAGMFHDPETGAISKESKRILLEMMEYGNWEILVDEDDKHLARARRENQSMVSGQIPAIRSFDDDLIHMAAHNDFRLSAEYEQLLIEHPEIDEVFDAHEDEHFQNFQTKNPPPPQEGFQYPVEQPAPISPEVMGGAQ